MSLSFDKKLAKLETDLDESMTAWDEKFAGGNEPLESAYLDGYSDAIAWALAFLRETTVTHELSRSRDRLTKAAAKAGAL